MTGEVGGNPSIPPPKHAVGARNAVDIGRLAVPENRPGVPDYVRGQGRRIAVSGPLVQSHETIVEEVFAMRWLQGHNQCADIT